MTTTMIDHNSTRFFQENPVFQAIHRHTPGAGIAFSQPPIEVFFQNASIILRPFSGGPIPTKDRINFPDAGYRKRRHRLKPAGPGNGRPESARDKPEPRFPVVIGSALITKKGNMRCQTQRHREK